MTPHGASKEVSEIKTALLFEKLCDAAPDGVLVINSGGEIIHVNARLENLCGYSRGELVGKPVDILVPEQTREAHAELHRAYLANAETRHMSISKEVCVWRKDGTEFPADIMLSPVLEAGDEPLVLVVLRDISERKQADFVREETVHFIASIVNSIADPVFVKDEKHRWVLLNNAYCKFMGYAREELIGKSDYDFFPKQEADVFWAKDDLVFSTGQENTNEESFTDADGSLHTIVTKKSLFTNPSGKKFIVGVIRDITEQKRTEKALRDREQQLEGIFENPTTIVYLKDLEGRYQKVNRAFGAAFGLSQAQVLGKTVEDLFPPEAAALLRGNDQKVIANRAPLIIEHDLALSDGTHTFISMKFPLKDSSGAVYAVGGIVTDITDRERAEEALRVREEQLQSILDNSPTGIFIKDLEGRFLRASRYCAQTFGLTEEQVVGKSTFDVFPREKAEELRGHEQQVINARRAMQFEDLILRMDGWHSYIATKFPIIGPSGEVNAVGGITIDITERKRAEEAVKESEERFRQIAENIRDFFWVRDAGTHKVLYANPAYEEIWRRPLQTFYEKPFD